MSEKASTLFGSGLYERRWERYAVDRQGTLIAVGSHLSAKSWNCKLIDISRGGVSFTVATTIGLPLHYYLSIVGLDQRIGCAEVYRNNNRIGVQFIREIDEDTLRTVVRAGYFTGGGTEKSRPNTRNRAGSTEWIAQGAALT